MARHLASRRSTPAFAPAVATLAACLAIPRRAIPETSGATSPTANCRLKRLPKPRLHRSEFSARVLREQARPHAFTIHLFACISFAKHPPVSAQASSAALFAFAWSAGRFDATVAPSAGVTRLFVARRIHLWPIPHTPERLSQRHNPVRRFPRVSVCSTPR